MPNLSILDFPISWNITLLKVYPYDFLNFIYIYVLSPVFCFQFY